MYFSHIYSIFLSLTSSRSALIPPPTHRMSSFFLNSPLCPMYAASLWVWGYSLESTYQKTKSKKADSPAWHLLAKEKLVFFSGVSLEIYKPHWRASSVLSSRWPTQNELNGIFGSSLSHVYLGLKKKNLEVLCMYVMASSFFFYFYEIPVCLNMCVSTSVFVSCASSFDSYSCLFCPIPACLFFFYLTLFYNYYSLDLCLFSV